MEQNTPSASGPTTGRAIPSDVNGANIALSIVGSAVAALLILGILIFLGRCVCCERCENVRHDDSEENNATADEEKTREVRLPVVIIQPDSAVEAGWIARKDSNSSIGGPRVTQTGTTVPLVRAPTVHLSLDERRPSFSSIHNSCAQNFSASGDLDSASEDKTPEKGKRKADVVGDIEEGAGI